MNYFICRTPYHNILANIYDCNNKKIINVEKNKIILKYRKFDNLISIYSFVIDILFLKRKNSRVFIFNDSNILEFFILKFTGDRFVKCYIEDGEAAYNHHELKYKSSFLIRLFDKVLGRKLNKRIGQSEYLNKGYYFFPKYVFYKRKIPHKICQFPLKLNFMETLIEMKDGIFLEPGIRNPRVLILGTKSPYLNRKMIKYVQENITSNYLIKEHPLKDDNVSFTRGKYVNKLIPAELLPIIYPSLEYLIGHRSTSLYSVKKFFPKMEVLLITDQEITNKEFYINVGVQIVWIDE